jgi:hypothetical protein
MKRILKHGRIIKLAPPNSQGVDTSTIWLVTRTGKNNDVFVGSFPSCHEARGYIDNCVARRERERYDVEGVDPRALLDRI